ncbi:MAG: site-specific integrase [Algoriphagus sp.]|uniref:tyrosine-type recombinase/integrase n=1 Tax=Algoriphagus sp. TaxID=1872435 RepID=UPI00260EE7F0|nr:site-specific integrase [Algoriphagus sp.]MDG1276086.1 site-specific integrase [Algoriphagus sp.]
MIYLAYKALRMEKIFVSITLDKRRIKKNGKFPVKLQVFQPEPRKQKLYSTIFEFQEKEFQSIWETRKPREDHKQARKKLEALETKASKIAESLEPFSFEAFEEKFFNTSKGDYKNAFYIFDEIEKQKLENGAISTAEKYRLAKTSLQNYLKHKKQDSENLTFDKITVQFLESYQSYSENMKNLSAATIGIYLRNLRAVYRIGIKNGTASLDRYPFFKDGYKIPTSKKVNKALTESQLKQLWETEPLTPVQARAKDFWFFSYFTFGMNTRDVCELKHSSIDSDSIQYIRAKTKNTKKERSIKQVPLTNSIKQIIERRKKPESPYLFGILDEKENPTQRHEKIRNFNKVINQHFRAFAKVAGIDASFADQIGTYHARHSFTTVSIRKGKSIALISEILHDGNLKVTENYINSFPKEAFKELSNDLEF